MTKKKKITLRDIADKFNVSISTVSKAINDSYEISAKTKTKIRDYAKLHNYKAKNSSVSQPAKKTKTIGVIIPNILNHFFTRVFVGIEKVATENGYNLITCISNESFKKEVKTLELLKNSALDGFILSMAEETQIKKDFDHLQNILDRGVPMIMFDRVTNFVQCDKVIVSDEEGAYQATNLFIKTGCTSIAIVSKIHNLNIGKLRLKGYKKALQEAGLRVNNKLILKIDEFNDMQTMLKNLLDTQKVDALLCLEEDSAVTSLMMVRDRGYRIPEDISIIGFTNGVLPKYVTPTITTVSQHGTFLGETAMNMLIKKLENKTDQTPPETKIIKTHIIERETTKPYQ